MLAEIHDHLRTALAGPIWGRIEVAEDIDAVADLAGQLDSGSLIVAPWREQAGNQILASGGFRQRVAMQFLAGVVLRHYDDFLGQARALQFDTYLRGLEAALAGWEPPGGISPCQLVGGESSPVSKGVSIYVQTWETARFLTGA
ncbi:hypothetical protein [Paracoccus sp. (in: a-proteobacteria)]|uniref:phage tail terminator protein n=1 Tax=Paracoccus sp. TaxID=267 RepID=UPI00321F88C3